MSREEHQANDFIPYPVNTVVGTIAETTQARATIEALLQRGIDPASIDLLYGDTGLRRLDPDGAEHGFWARFQRTLVNTLAINAESSHLARHLEDLPPATSSSWCISQRRRNATGDRRDAEGRRGRAYWFFRAVGVAVSRHAARWEFAALRKCL